MATRLLNVMSKQDESFPSMHVIINDNIEGKNVPLQFGGWFSWSSNKSKTEYIYSCSAEEREDLIECFQKKQEKHRFSAADGNYELYYPVKADSGFIVLYFTDRQRYGKIGS